MISFSDDYNTLYRNQGGGALYDVTHQAGLEQPTIPFLGWGTGLLDFDNDGRLDLFAAKGHVFLGVSNNLDSTPVLLRNVVSNGNHWVKLKLIGGRNSPRDAIGARVFLSADGVHQRADVCSGGSYGSNSDLWLGTATKMDSVEID